MCQREIGNVLKTGNEFRDFSPATFARSQSSLLLSSYVGCASSNYRTESNYCLIRTIVYRQSDCIEHRVKDRCIPRGDEPYFPSASDFRYNGEND